MPADKTAAAFAFVKFMNSAESQAFLADKLGLLPTRKSAYDIASVKNNAIISAFKPVVDAAAARPWIPEGGQFFGPLDTMATEVLVRAGPEGGPGRRGQEVQGRGRPGATARPERRHVRGRLARRAPVTPRHRTPAPDWSAADERRHGRPRTADRPVHPRTARPAGSGAAGTGTGTPGPWSPRSSSSSAVLIVYPLVRGIYLSLTNTTEANQLSEICTKSITGDEACEPNPNAADFVGLDNYVDVLTGEVGEFWQQFGVTLIWTVTCVVFHYGLGLGLAVLLNRPIGSAASTGCC